MCATTSAIARLDAFAGRAADYVQRARERDPRAHPRGAARCAVRGRDRRADHRRPARDSRGAMARLQPHRHHAPHQHLGPARDGVRGARRRARVRCSRGAACGSRRAFRRARSRPRSGVVAATLYVLLAGAQVPAVRTLLMLAVAALGLVARAARHGRRRLAVGAGRRARVGSVGGLHAGLLAVVRRRRAPALRARRPAVVARRRVARRARLRATLRAGARTQALVTIGARARDARAVPAGVARLAARERAGDSRRSRSPSCRSRSPAIVAAARRCRGRRRTRCSRR